MRNCLHGYDISGFEQIRRPRPGSDLEGEPSGAEKWEFYRLEKALIVPDNWKIGTKLVRRRRRSEGFGEMETLKNRKGKRNRTRARPCALVLYEVEEARS
ncbi:hypothetical protein ACFX2A_039444 [Malus domestica]